MGVELAQASGCSWCLTALGEARHYLCPGCRNLYHARCAEQIVHCLNCTVTLVEIDYPDVEDTLAGD